VTLVATAGSLPWIAVALLVAGLLASGVMVTRNLSLREALPPSAHAAGYSVMYAATGIGYGTSATLAGAVQSAASPSVAVLAGVGLTLLLIALSALGELKARRRAKQQGTGAEADAAGEPETADLERRTSSSPP
jgi:MFS family permease